MNWIEILLVVLGVAAFIFSFIIKGKKEEENEPIQVDPEIIKDMVNKEMEDARERVNEVVDETLQYAVEKTERASERISNEKIMAISEYSDTVLADINKSHQEVMFLYDMLNDKHDNIKETVKQVDKTTKEAKEISSEISEISKGIAQNEEKFETFTFVEQLPHITKSEVVAAQSQPQAVQNAVPIQTTVPVLPTQPIIMPQPEPVAAPVIPTAKIIEPVPIAPAVIEEPVVIENTNNEVNSVYEETEFYQQQDQQQTDIQQADTQPENNNDRILEMHKAGIDNVEIAKELGLGVGEVKLVINLFKGAI
jgi:hypothetical protein